MKNIILKQIIIILSTILIFNIVFLPTSNAIKTKEGERASEDVTDSFSSIDDFIEARGY